MKTASATRGESNVFDLAREKWRSSGLTDDHAKRLKFKPINDTETYAMMKEGGAKDPMAVAAMILPYFDLNGKVTEFFRVRFLEKLPGFAGIVEKPQRYWQPARTLNEVYFPPLMAATWLEIAKDPHAPIYITEGEFKAAAGCSVGLPTFGLGGVDVWRSTRRGIDLLPALKEIEWKNRSVVIVYDSDAATNPNVVRAQRQLAHELISRGALPAVATLPPAKDGSKQGLDDFLVDHSADALLKLLEESPLFPEADALWSLNQEVLYVRDPGLIVELRTGMRIAPTQFTQHAYADRHYIETQQTKNGGLVAKKRPLARRWIEWEGRFKVERMTYAPGKPKIYDGVYNAWPGWAVEPRRGDMGPWKWLMNFLFKGHEMEKEWFEKWCAYPLQHPGAKMYTAVMIWGREKGTGKSLAFYALQGIYGVNSIEINNKDLKSGFNSWAKNRQFVHMSEISGTEARVDSDWLKNQITQSQVRINEKYLPEYVVPDCINYGGTSNHPDSLFIEDEDRRYFIHEVVGKPAERALYDTCHQWLHGDGRPGSYKGAGAAALFDYMLKLDLTGFNPLERAPMTEAKKAMMLNGKSDIGMWCVGLREDPVLALGPLGERVAKECDLFTPTLLLRAYCPEGTTKVTVNGVAREVIKAGMRQMNGASPIRTKVGLVRLYAVRNQERWINATPKQLGDHFDKFFGPGGTKYT